MTQTVIPAGYRITVVSWENDADNYNTQTVDGIETPGEVCFLVDLLKLLTKSTWEGSGYFGNIYEPTDDQIANFTMAVKEIFYRHKDNLPETYQENWPEDDCQFLDWANDIYYAYTGESESFYTRKIKSIRVEYVPEPIYIDDVTSRFL